MEKPVFDAILQRRSIRKYTSQKVEEEKIDLLLKAGMAAPSACNLQPWSFIVVDDPLILDQVKKATGQGQYNAPLAIVVCGEYKHRPWKGEDYLIDCGMATENILLEAVELGLASVVIGGFEEDELRKVLDIPEDVKPIVIVEIGYPATSRAPLTWYDESAVHYQKYDKARKRTMRTMAMLKDDIKKGII